MLRHSLLRPTATLALVMTLLAGCSESREPDVNPAVTSPAGTRSLQEVVRDERAPCESSEPLRQPFYGDVHIHTGYSSDAYSRGVRVNPHDAYRFARGEEIPLTDGRVAQLARPLDFAAVTDHAEMLGEQRLCLEQGSAVYDSIRCKTFRGEVGEAGGAAARLSALTSGRPPFVTLPRWGKFGLQARSIEICGAGLSRCRAATRTVWQEIQVAAERWYDRSAECRFTTFNAYEYSWSPQLSKVHRNVIFRNVQVPDRPVSAVDAVEPIDLWQSLKRECIDAGTGCDALAIPHNSNLSDGRMFSLELASLPEGEARLQAALRAELEPLVEIQQVKGDSECKNGLPGVLGGSDELCDFEKIRPDTTPGCGDGTGYGAIAGLGCIKPVDYVRYALIEGVREHARLGVNPLKLGITASTDTHNGTPGATEEQTYQGSHGQQDASTAARFASSSALAGRLRLNPGGLVGIWAEENQRDSLFDAMQRRETFGTSGVRIAPRFFGGWEYPRNLCERGDLLAQADAAGVPMGGDLPAPPAGAQSPVFVVSALRDPGTRAHPGGRLERIQIIKGWAGEAGTFHQAIYDVAGSAAEPDVDPNRCEPGASGHDSLCAVWSDPSFDAEQGAVYYARVLERPTCRWNAHECLRVPVEERSDACSDASIPKLIRERAWTSPIWYTPRR